MTSRKLSAIVVTALLSISCAHAGEVEGLDVEFGFKWDMLRNHSGGLARGGRPMTHFDLKLKGDLGELVGWQGSTACVNLIYDGGGKTNRDYVGSLMGVSNIEVPVSTERLFHAWLEQAFADDSWFLLAGLYPIDSEFQVLDTAALFVQPPYGATADLALTRGPSIFNQSAFGLRGKWQSADSGVYLLGAVLDGIPGDLRQPRGTHVRFDKGDGTMQIVEAGYKPEGNGNFEKYAAGYWRHTAKVDDLIDTDAAGNPEPRRSLGWYALAERTLLQWQDGQLAAFFRYSRTDGNSTPISRSANLGMRVAGLLPGRPDDLLGLAHTRSTIGAKWRASQEMGGTATESHESATELTYRVALNLWLAVQPLLQHIRHPGAVTNMPRASLYGVRLEVAL